MHQCVFSKVMKCCFVWTFCSYGEINKIRYTKTTFIKRAI